MPTLNPRVNVTLSPSLDVLVTRMAAHQRVSKSQVLRELLETAEPALQRVAALLDAASTASREVLSGLAGRAGAVGAGAADDLAVNLSRLDLLRDLVSEAEAIDGKRPRRRAVAASPSAQFQQRAVAPSPPSKGAPRRGGNPPASNRGVKSVGAGRKRVARKAGR
jgi:hypothetical protein